MTATLSVTGDQDEAVLPEVQAFFESSRRFLSWTWLEPGQSLRSGTGANAWSVQTLLHSFATGGEVMLVSARSTGPGRTELDVTSASYPLYDWGQNHRNIRHLIEYLQERDLGVAVCSIVSKHTLGGPRL